MAFSSGGFNPSFRTSRKCYVCSKCGNEERMSPHHYGVNKKCPCGYDPQPHISETSETYLEAYPPGEILPPPIPEETVERISEKMREIEKKWEPDLKRAILCIKDSLENDRMDEENRLDDAFIKLSVIVSGSLFFYFLDKVEQVTEIESE